MDPILQITIAIIGSGALFSFIQFLIQRRDKKSEKIDTLCKKIDEGLKNQAKTTEKSYNVLKDEIKEGLQVQQNWGFKHYEEHKESIDKLEEAILQLTSNDTQMQTYMKYVGDEIMGLAHNKLVELTDKYQLRGAITLKEKATLEAIYKPYHEGLGGNGDGEQGYQYAMNLPVVTDTQALEMDKELNKKL